MAIQYSRYYDINGPGGLQGYLAGGVLVAGACDVPHGFKVIERCTITPIHASAAVAAQTLTLTGLTIGTTGFPKASAGISTVKSDVGASTIAFLIDIAGYGS